MSRKSAPKKAVETKQNPAAIEAESPVQQEIVEEPPQPLTALQRMRRVNALTGVLSNREFLELILSMPEGSYLMDVFARSIENELEGMFQGDAKVKESLSSLVSAIDVAYAKVQAMANSPLQSVLDRLVTNLGGSTSSPTSPSASVPMGGRRGEGVMGF